jgi:hypothetical protein
MNVLVIVSGETRPMNEYNARDIMALPKEALWALDNVRGRIIVNFDDGPLETSMRRTIYSAYVWEIHRQYPTTPLLKEHHMGLRAYSGKAHAMLLENSYRSCFFANYGQENFDVEELWSVMYKIVNDIYCDFNENCSEYVGSLCILDYIELMRHPDIVEANQNIRPTQKSIDECYDKVTSVLENDPSLANNMIARSVRSKIVDIKQVLQSVAARGFVTEIDSSIFPKPITVGFAKGFSHLYDSLIESRSASKALMFAKDPLAECEYFNRKMQLVAQVVDTLVAGDCGSNYYLPWTVEAGELAAMEGINYVENGQVFTLKSTDQHLVGKTLNLRTPFGCKHNDRQTVCETCFGQTAFSIPRATNLGHVSAIALGEKVSQLVLSTKHVDGSSQVDEVNIGEYYADYMIPGSEDNTLRLSPRLKDVPLKLVIPAEAAPGLPGIGNRNDIDEVKLGTISELIEITFQIGDQNDVENYKELKVPAAMGARRGSLSRQALWYIYHNDFQLNDRGDYILDMAKWDNTLPLVELPLKHINMVDFKNEIEAFILSADRKAGLAAAAHAIPTDALKAFLALVSTRLNINLSHIMIMAYSVSVVSRKENDYRLPRGGEIFEFAPITEIMNHRSGGVMMAYERQEQWFMKPETYVLKDRLRHPMDNLLLG